MPPFDVSLAIVVGIAILGAAVLYSSVGHGGASAYLAVMALAQLAPETMKPTALALNIMVSGVATVQFVRAGHLSLRLLWPFVVTSIPLAALGGAIELPVGIYRPIVGVVLWCAAIQMVLMTRRKAAAVESQNVSHPPVPLALLIGGGLGFLSGLVGVGGGIFLSPLILLCGWAAPRQTSAVAAVFILVNSMAGLAGHWTSVRHIPAEVIVWGPAAVTGGLIGATLGSRYMPSAWIRRALAAVLVIAGAKLVLT